jgi:hypothetical protein
MTPLRALATAVWTLALLDPAGAGTFRIVNADRPAEFLDVDCPQNPEGHILNWVARNCRPALTATSTASRVVVHGWNSKDKKAFVGEAEGDPDRPIISGTVPNSGGRPPQ